MFLPELLSPAGNLQKLKAAIIYGADAVYLAGQKYGLRSAADNFTYDELAEALDFVHGRSRKAYLVLNSFLHDSDFEGLKEFVSFAHSINIDGFIISDLGVIQLVQKVSDKPIHLSTQASCLNLESALVWKQMGVKRLILGREVSIKEAGHIKKSSGLEVELFIHGSMCMAYSGQCVISNFTQGRDSNRGGCAQSCRFQYQLVDQTQTAFQEHDTFMSSKDLMGLSLLPDFCEYQIDSIKVEGRMRSVLYAASVSKVYREALDHLKNNGPFMPQNKLKDWRLQLELLPHRDYMEASLASSEHLKSMDHVYNEKISQDRPFFEFVGQVIQYDPNKGFLVLLSCKLSLQDQVEWVVTEGRPIEFNVTRLTQLMGQEVQQGRLNSMVWIGFSDQTGLALIGNDSAIGTILRRITK